MLNAIHDSKADISKINKCKKKKKIKQETKPRAESNYTALAVF